MKKRIPLILTALGLVVIAGGFLYDVMFAGIPYQDPTPELQSAYRYHAKIASETMQVGFGVFVIGLLGICILAVLKKKTPNKSPPPTPQSRGG